LVCSLIAFILLSFLCKGRAKAKAGFFKLNAAVV